MGHIILYAICILIMVIHLKPTKETVETMQGSEFNSGSNVFEVFTPALTALPIFLALEAIYWVGHWVF